MQEQSNILRKEFDRAIYKVGCDLEVPVMPNEGGDWCTAKLHELPCFYKVKDFRIRDFRAPRNFDECENASDSDKNA